MASEAFYNENTANNALVHDRNDINYTCVLQYLYYLGLIVRRAEMRTHI